MVEDVESSSRIPDPGDDQRQGFLNPMQGPANLQPHEVKKHVEGFKSQYKIFVKLVRWC